MVSSVFIQQLTIDTITTSLFMHRPLLVVPLFPSFISATRAALAMTIHYTSHYSARKLSTHCEVFCE